MKKILITGENSYIGGMFTEWVAKWPDKYSVDEISVRGEDWKQVDFSEYDVVLHVAAIVHKKESAQYLDLYYKVNRDLAFEVAKKSKNNGVSQFIFMSTMNVYGISRGIISKNTPCNPKTLYGKSKLEAENLIMGLEDNTFNLTIIRPPMVYGPNATGNYSIISKFAKKIPLFPNVDNERSMIYIDNLNEFLRGIIECKLSGVFTPQNTKYVKTSELVKVIAEVNNRKSYQTKMFNFIFYLLTRFNIIEKVFGSLVYEKDSSTEYYNIVSFRDSIYQSENLTHLS